MRAMVMQNIKDKTPRYWSAQGGGRKGWRLDSADNESDYIDVNARLLEQNCRKRRAIPA